MESKIAENFSELRSVGKIGDVTVRVNDEVPALVTSRMNRPRPLARLLRCESLRMNSVAAFALLLLDSQREESASVPNAIREPKARRWSACDRRQL